jgi:hypothetical protein
VVRPTQFLIYARDIAQPRLIELAPGTDPRHARELLDNAHRLGIAVPLRVVDPDTGRPTEVSIDGSTLAGVGFVPPDAGTD